MLRHTWVQPQTKCSVQSWQENEDIDSNRNLLLYVSTGVQSADHVTISGEITSSLPDYIETTDASSTDHADGIPWHAHSFKNT